MKIVGMLLFSKKSLLPFFAPLAQHRKSTVKPAHLVDDPILHRLVAVDDRAAIGRDLIGAHHQLVDLVGVSLGMRADKGDDPLLHLAHIAKGLRNAHHHAADAHGVNGHCRARYDKRIICRRCKRHADGVPPAKHERHRWLFH